MLFVPVSNPPPPTLPLPLAALSGAAPHVLLSCLVLSCPSLSSSRLCRVVSERAGPGSAEGLEELLDLMGEGAEARGVGGVRTGRVHAEALAGNGIGERYCMYRIECFLCVNVCVCERGGGDINER